MGVRVAGTMKVDAKLGGRIVNSEGQTDGDAWAKRAAWVDYHGPVDGLTVGVAILNHPSSFRFPTYWHVRTYGLFAANPFGWQDFQRSDDVDGSCALAPGESITLVAHAALRGIYFVDAALYVGLAAGMVPHAIAAALVGGWSAPHRAELIRAGGVTIVR